MMSADELGSIWNSAPLRVTQAIKQAGKELDREQKKKDQTRDGLPEREHDSIELSATKDAAQSVLVHEHPVEPDDQFSGSHIDLTIG